MQLNDLYPAPGSRKDRKRVGRGNAIKTSGKHEVEVNFYREISATVTVLVGVTEEEPDTVILPDGLLPA